MPLKAPYWKDRFWHNTLSAYAQIITRMATGLILFRQFFQALSPEAFGFWALLWSVFGYGVLLDFGFGLTAQKTIAQRSALGDTEGLNKLLSTIFWSFVGLAVILFTVSVCFAHTFMKWVGVTPACWDEFHKVYLIFFGGMALVFPIGIFPEILRGLQRIDYANWINTANSIFFLGALLLVIYLELPFHDLMLTSIVASLIPNLCAAIVALRLMPGVSLSPKYFDFKSVRAQMSFSAAAYLITCSNLIVGKSDQLVISAVLGVGLVTIYQAGSKMGETLDTFCTQLQTALSPAAAQMSALQDHEGLRNLFSKSSSLTFLVSTPVYLLSATYLERLLQLLTGDLHPPTTTLWVGQALMAAIYSSQLTNSCSKKILIMCGYERRILALSIADALTNLVLSITLAKSIGVLGV
ncbi:MAG TPA: oligosaccharide flippase family protein, partial [Opitutales bacterium]|nr:oligosaccharide flippase family protein [Opitutales bacterium]